MNAQWSEAARLLGRIALSLIFVIGGYGKLTGYAGALGYMAKVGVPSAMLPLVIASELIGGLLLLTGFKTSWVALYLAAFTLAAGFIGHLQFGDPGNMIHFWKNLAIVGGLLSVAAIGGGAWSLDGWAGKRAAA